MYEIYKTDEYVEWYESQNTPTKLLVEARLQRLVEYGHIGKSRHLSGSLFEMKWKNGLSIYFMFKGKQVVILLAGGTKHGQERDIQRAKKLKDALED
ncbi:MAG: type II toxin-antitoxin system RelE/ParE family toxin [Pseudomonadota bacterium]